jgi:hypothetical protein
VSFSGGCSEGCSGGGRGGGGEGEGAGACAGAGTSEGGAAPAAPDQFAAFDQQRQKQKQQQKQQLQQKQQQNPFVAFEQRRQQGGCKRLGDARAVRGGKKSRQGDGKPTPPVSSIASWLSKKQ